VYYSQYLSDSFSSWDKHSKRTELLIEYILVLFISGTSQRDIKKSFQERYKPPITMLRLPQDILMTIIIPKLVHK